MSVFHQQNIRAVGFLPPRLGDGRFGAPSGYGAGPAQASLAALAGPGDGGAVEIVYCDVTPADLARAGSALVKAASAARMAEAEA